MHFRAEMIRLGGDNGKALGFVPAVPKTSKHEGRMVQKLRPRLSGTPADGSE